MPEVYTYKSVYMYVDKLYINGIALVVLLFYIAESGCCKSSFADSPMQHVQIHIQCCCLETHVKLMRGI